MTRRDAISRLRNSIKELSGDSLYSNRFLWNLFQTASKTLIKQEAERGRLYSQANIWETICVEMEQVSSLICNCSFLPYDCMVTRSKYKIPLFVEYSGGFIYRFIATPDLSKEFVLVTPFQYATKSKIKYVKEHYAFIHNGYLYTPSHHFPLLSVSGIFEGDVSKFKCDDTSDSSSCNSALDRPIGIPEYLEDIVFKQALQELGFSKQIPADEHPNNNDSQKTVSP